MKIRLILSYVLVLIVGLSAGAIGGYVVKSLDTETKMVIESNGEVAAETEQVQLSKTTESNVPVVYNPENIHNTNMKNELATKLINPMSDYAKIKGEPVASVILSLAGGKKKGAWDVYVIYENGKTGNFLFGKAEIQAQSWWTPSCEKCEFTDDYESLYPEVVKLSST